MSEGAVFELPALAALTGPYVDIEAPTLDGGPLQLHASKDERGPWRDLVVSLDGDLVKVARRDGSDFHAVVAHSARVGVPSERMWSPLLKNPIGVLILRNTGINNEWMLENVEYSDIGNHFEMGQLLEKITETAL